MAPIGKLAKPNLLSLVSKQLLAIYLGGNLLEFKISALQHFKELKYGYLKIKGGDHRQSCQTKYTQYGLMRIFISVHLLRYLRHQNLSTSDDFIHSSGIMFLVIFLGTREAVPPIKNDPIISGRSKQQLRHLEH